MPSAAILGGGRATRLGGRDKSALLVGGRSILDRQVAELSKVTDDIVLVGAAAGGIETPNELLRTVPDRVPDRGPLGGLDAALAAARDDEVFVVACDMPFVTAALVQYLLTLAAGYDIVVPRTNGRYHPLCSIYRRTCAATVTRRLAAGELAMLGLFEGLRVRTVTGEELDAVGDRDRLLVNVNTPAEYGELESLQGHRR